MFFHPLLESPASLKDADLDAKIIDLSQKYLSAQRFGQGGVCEQILVILLTLKEEQSRRSQAMLKKSQTGQNKNLDDLINVR